DTHKHRSLCRATEYDASLSRAVASLRGLTKPTDILRPINEYLRAEAEPNNDEPTNANRYPERSIARSQQRLPATTIAGRKIAVLVADGFDGVALQKMKMYLEGLKHAQFQLIAPHGGTVRCADNIEHLVDAALMTTESVLFDALYIPGGVNSIAALTREGKVFKFINEALKHCKVIAFDGEAEELFQLSAAKDFVGDEAILLNESPEQFAGALAKHRNWLREPNTLHI